MAMNNKYALITGASGGIGKDMARILAARGYNLILVARNEDKLKENKDEIEKEYNINVEVILNDLSRADAPEYIFDEVNKKNIHIDVLINNAGYGINEYFKNIPFERENIMLNLLVNNLIHITKLFVKGMIEKKSGYILNVSSTAAFQPSPTYSSYGAAKGFVFNFTIALAHELQNHEVKCSVVCPGVTLTGFKEASEHKADNFYQRNTAMTSERVAKIAIDGLFRGKKIIVPGIFNQFGVFLTRFFPRYFAAKVAFNAAGFSEN